MPGYSPNEFKCLTNAVLQAGIKNQVAAVYAVLGAVREMMRDNDIALDGLVSIHLSQHSLGIGRIEFALTLIEMKDDVPRFYKMEGLEWLGDEIEDREILLYDRQRDGVMEFLHLIQ